MKPIDPQGCDESRRSFIAKAIYVTPLILTLKADPSFASSGSGAESAAKPPKDHKYHGNNKNKDKHNKGDKRHR
jgi:hypothetical protein